MRGRSWWWLTGFSREKPGVPKGHSKLTEDQVLAIYRDHKDGKPQWELADEFGVSQPNISAICSGRTWAWLTGAGR